MSDYNEYDDCSSTDCDFEDDIILEERQPDDSWTFQSCKWFKKLKECGFINSSTHRSFALDLIDRFWCKGILSVSYPIADHLILHQMANDFSMFVQKSTVSSPSTDDIEYIYPIQ